MLMINRPYHHEFLVTVMMTVTMAKIIYLFLVIASAAKTWSPSSCSLRPSILAMMVVMMMVMVMVSINVDDDDGDDGNDLYINLIIVGDVGDL